MKQKKKRQVLGRIVGGAFALAAVTLIIFGFLPKPVPVVVSAATRGPLEVVVEESGRTRIRSPYVLSAPVFGSVSRITLRPGDMVEAEDALAQIAPVASALLDPRSRAEAQGRAGVARANVSRAKATIQRAEAALNYAREQAGRLRTLRSAEGTSQQALDQAEFELRTAEEDYRSARLGQRVAENELALALAAAEVHSPSEEGSPAIAIHSPISGRVLRVFQQSESVVQPGTPLIEIGDPSSLEIVVDVLTTEAIAIERGAKATIERWGGPRPLSASVRTKEPSAFTTRSALGVEEQRVSVVLDITDPYETWKALSDGYRVEAKIQVGLVEDALRVPASAVFRRGKDWSTFAVVDGHAQETTVEVGVRTPDQVEITKGLEEARDVVLYPSDQVEEGVALAVSRAR